MDTDTAVKHTVGRWHTSGTAGHELHGQYAVYDEDGRDIAIVYNGPANATLIASAPTLLAALKDLDEAVRIQTIEGGLTSSIAEAWQQARKAIQQAEGA